MARKNQPTIDEDLATRIRDGLSVLRLPHARRQFDAMLAQPEAGQNRLAWLWALLEPQVHSRVENRIERRIREARLPERKTLAGFDFDFQPTLDRDLVLELGTLGFVDGGVNVLLAGMSGTGKSHIAMALALNACAANRRVRYTTNAAMLETLNANLACGTLDQELQQYVRPDLLVIDEVGLEQVERLVASRAGLMQKVLLPRYTGLRSTVITSNIPWESWGDYLEDHLGAGALLDRLIHRSHVIVISGPSYRDHMHQQQIASARSNEVRQQKGRRRGRQPA